MNKIGLTTVFMLIMIHEAMADTFDFFRNTGKMYSVYAGVLVLFLGLAIYLFSLDKKISKIEGDKISFEGADFTKTMDDLLMKSEVEAEGQEDLTKKLGELKTKKPEDIKKVIVPVLRHRVILTPEREMEGMTTDKVIEMIVQSVEVPR